MLVRPATVDSAAESQRRAEPVAQLSAARLALAEPCYSLPEQAQPKRSQLLAGQVVQLALRPVPAELTPAVQQAKPVALVELRQSSQAQAEQPTPRVPMRLASAVPQVSRQVPVGLRQGIRRLRQVLAVP